MRHKSTSNSTAHTCVVSGVQQAALEEDMPLVIKELRWEIRRSIFLGYDTFASCMTKGVSLVAAEQILLLRQEYPHIKLHCFLPCETQATHWPEFWRERYFNVLAHANDVTYLQTRYTPGCLQKNTRAMLLHSSRLLVIQQSANSSPYILHHAKTIGLDIISIIPSYLQNGAAEAHVLA